MRTPTWIVGGALLALSALPLVVQYAGVWGLPLNWALFEMLAPAFLLLFPLALAVMAIGFRAEDSVVGRTPMGVAALFVVALAEVALSSGIAAFGGLGLTVAIVQLAAAIVAVVEIRRRRIVPVPVAVAGLLALVLTAVGTGASAIGFPGGIATALFVVGPLMIIGKLAQIAAGVALIVAGVRGTRGSGAQPARPAQGS